MSLLHATVATSFLPIDCSSEVPLKVRIPGMISGCTGTDHARKRTQECAVCTAFET
jgi:hypothetical protein